MTDLVNDLPKLGAEAMGPCVCCGRQLLETGLPIFFRIEAKQCGVDANAVRKHVGLAMAMGGGSAGLALAGVMGPKVEPVVVMDAITPFNVCHDCAAGEQVALLHAIGVQWEADRAAKRGEERPDG